MPGASGCSRRFLHAALAAYKDQWNADFLADRKRVFPDVDFDMLDVSRRSIGAVRCGPTLGAIKAQLGLGDFLGGNRRMAGMFTPGVWCG